MKVTLNKVNGYENFKRECRFYSCKEQYPNWSGAEKYIVISILTKEQLEEKYPEIAQFISPYILGDTSWLEIFEDYRRNDMKFHWRSVNKDIGAGFDGQTERHYPELVDDFTEEDILFSMTLKEALEYLTDSEKERVQLYYFMGLSMEEIAVREGVSVQAVSQSIRRALKKMRIFFE